MPRPYKLKTTTSAVKRFQAARKEAHLTTTVELATQHRDILIDALLQYFVTLTTPNDVLLQTTKATSSLARYTIYTLMREAGYTITTIAATLNRNPATVTLGIEHFNKEIIDKPDIPHYSNAYMRKYTDMPKPALLHALKDLREFNLDLIQEGSDVGLREEIDQRQSEAQRNTIPYAGSEES